MRGLIGRKLGMSRFFTPDGTAVPVTLVEAGPNLVVQVKAKKSHGYEALQLGFGRKSEKSSTKPHLGHLKKAKLPPVARLREVRVDTVEGFVQGQTIPVDIFQVGEKVDVVGMSKGLGFQGVVRRHHFAGGPKTHGQSDRLRAPGSVGSSSYPSRSYKGLKMGGRMGGDRVTVKNLTVRIVDTENQIIALEGAVPGKRNSFLTIRKK